MALGRRGGADSYRVISGGASDPLVFSGLVDPSAGAGVAATEGSLYLRYAAGAGEVWVKSGAANTAWTKLGSGGGGGGSIEYMDTINVAAPTNAVTFGAGGSGIHGTALDGDTDRIYWIKFRVYMTADDDLVLRPNNNLNNQLSQRATLESARTSFADRLIMVDGLAGGLYEDGDLYFDARRTVAGVAHLPTYYGLSYFFNTGAGTVWNRSISGRWNDTTTNITSLVIAAMSGANNLIAGCSFDLYKVKDS